ncbi:MAG: T9SS type A sorting domain-containing protein [Bacteroidales bacterium]|nr:T9SS type A sorting domain-containing protein [Bacteroidales bacterium]
MRIQTFTIIIIFCLSFHLNAQKQVVGYYPNWQWYDRSQLVNPETIFYEKYTIINYAFFRPMANGEITSTDGWADENLLLGPMVWWPVQYHDSTRSLPYLARQAGVKLLPSIGGWNDSSTFPDIAANPDKRQVFVNSCLTLINTYKFDGIDLDWEYPGYAPHGGSAADKANFTLLLQDLRLALDNLSTQTGKEYLLTSCFGAAQTHMQHIDWEGVLPLVDYVNLMTYDFHGSWDPESNHHTPLYSPAVGDPDWCFHGAFTLLTQTYGVPTEQINIGVAFYGKGLANCTQLYGSHTGYDGSTFWEDEGQPLFYNILKRMNLFTRYWDDQVKSPYLLGNTINTFVTYDDPVSIGHKAEYVMNNDIGGVIIWEITGDYIETSPGSGVIAGTPLLDTLLFVFNNTTTINKPKHDSVTIYPNPAKDFLRIISAYPVEQIQLMTMTGQVVTERKNNSIIDVSGVSDGVYLVVIKIGKETYTQKLIVTR